MRKNREQQQNKGIEQLELFTEQTKRPVYEGISLDTYNEIKFDP